ncbi:DUF871 family protein [Sulfolobus sp. S-194]|uniref:MupG family TIM beta-alpha barrel fold protein n=1 Tax=Sulfolobus sp. S-194 TaxID=2512240 RepID=UPI001436CEEF|nr:MupG family TIM beta-alpha barrel fold protein [Sulfolobus sp. S-194]QIW22725.1 DUF871 family protein [Sulfolobus sp. S-194]
MGQRKKIGFSIFPGWKEIKREQLDIIKIARNYGYSEIFFGIGPGTHWKTSVEEAIILAKDFLEEAKDYYTFVDINPDILKRVNASPKDLSKFINMGFKAVRADYGFSKEEIVEMSKQMVVELNPFEITEAELEFIMNNADLERIKAIHNYYPVFYTGISKEIFEEKNKLLKKWGIEIGAFISHPLYNLRTTLEMLRFVQPFDSANYLSHFVDRVLIGDPTPKEEWLKDVSIAFKSNKVRIKLYDERFKEFLKSKFYLYEEKEYAIVCKSKERIENNLKCHTKIFKNAVTLLNNDIYIFKKDLGVGPFTLIGEIDDLNIEILKMKKEFEFLT